jgi:hypothetical protein
VKASEALVFFRAALHAVAPEAFGHDATVSFRSGSELVEWATGVDPWGAALVERLPARARSDVLHVLDGMLRERSLRSGVATIV